ncbi:MAG: hypothetical protein H7330_10790 [Hymenobacteraceae bacterium]|nr:hypothetical protein [Hymenobacteraceae bacterium]
MLGLVIAGRYARDVEHTNPGRSFNEILRASTATLPTALPASRPQAVAPQGLTHTLPVIGKPQSASFTEVN